MAQNVSLMEMIGIFAIAHAEHEHHIRSVLEDAAKVVRDEAKAEIGTYQTGIGPFSEWPELADRTKEERSKKGYSENEPLLRDGTLKDSIAYEVEAHGNSGKADVGSPLPVALYQELGTPNAKFPIPPRSFLGGALVRKTDVVVDKVGGGFVGHLFGSGTKARIP